MAEDKTAKAKVLPVRQRSQYTCMATSLSMCLKALGIETNEDEVNRVMGARPMKGARWEEAFAAAQHFGARATLVTPCTVQALKEWTDAGTPVMISWNPEKRDWSHASVVFDITEENGTLMVHVADPNIPNPSETVRVISEDEFYGKWAESWDNYMVRRVAMAVEREITPEGRQVQASAGRWERLSKGGQKFITDEIMCWVTPEDTWDTVRDRDVPDLYEVADPELLADGIPELVKMYQNAENDHAKWVRQGWWPKPVKVQKWKIYIMTRRPAVKNFESDYFKSEREALKMAEKAIPIIQASKRPRWMKPASHKTAADHRWVKDGPNVYTLKHRRLGDVGSVEKQGAKWMVYDEDGERPIAKEYSLDMAQEALLEHLDVSDSDVRKAATQENTMDKESRRRGKKPQKVNAPKDPKEKMRIKLTPGKQRNEDAKFLAENRGFGNPGAHKNKGKRKEGPMRKRKHKKTWDREGGAEENRLSVYSPEKGDGLTQPLSTRPDYGSEESFMMDVNDMKNALTQTTESASPEALDTAEFQARLANAKTAYSNPKSALKSLNTLKSDISSYAGGLVRNKPDDAKKKALRDALASVKKDLTPKGGSNTFGPASFWDSYLTLERDLGKLLELTPEDGKNKAKTWAAKTSKSLQRFTDNAKEWTKDASTKTADGAEKLFKKPYQSVEKEVAPDKIVDMDDEVEKQTKQRIKTDEKNEGKQAKLDRKNLKRGDKVWYDNQPATVVAVSGSKVSLKVDGDTIKTEPGLDHRLQMYKGEKIPPLSKYMRSAGASSDIERLLTAALEVKKLQGKGLYGYNVGTQRTVEATIRKATRRANSIAKALYKKDPRTAAFLGTHAKRTKSASARILVACMKNLGPKFASETEKTAGLGMYGMNSKTAKLALAACTDVTESMGQLAYDLHARKASRHERITGFLGAHSKSARCLYAKMLLASYPEAATILTAAEDKTADKCDKLPPALQENCKNGPPGAKSKKKDDKKDSKKDDGKMPPELLEKFKAKKKKAADRTWADFNTALAKLMKGLKRDVGAKKIKQNGSASAAGNRNIWVQLPNRGNVDVWVEDGQTQLFKLLRAGGTERGPVIPYGKQTPEQVYKKMVAGLKDIDKQAEMRKKADDGEAEKEKEAKFEKGKPADPTENMTEEQKKKWMEHHGQIGNKKKAKLGLKRERSWKHRKDSGSDVYSVQLKGNVPFSNMWVSVSSMDAKSEKTALLTVKMSDGTLYNKSIKGKSTDAKVAAFELADKLFQAKAEDPAKMGLKKSSGPAPKAASTPTRTRLTDRRKAANSGLPEGSDEEPKSGFPGVEESEENQPDMSQHGYDPGQTKNANIKLLAAEISKLILQAGEEEEASSSMPGDEESDAAQPDMKGKGYENGEVEDSVHENGKHVDKGGYKPGEVKKATVRVVELDEGDLMWLED